MEDSVKEQLFHKAVSLLKHTSVTQKDGYLSLISAQGEFAQRVEEIIGYGRENNSGWDISPYAFMVVWVPYQIRCHYFHSNDPMPIFMFKDDELIHALEYSNYFVERFIEETMPDWMDAKELSDEQRKLLLAAEKRI